MSDGVLSIGQRRYSSWSMRGWLAVKLAGLDVEVKALRFTRPGPTQAIAALSPNGLVPFLEHKGARAWESLGVCEYCAEQEPGLWPADREARAYARSISAEMHAGFRELRAAMWMNLGRDYAGLGRTAGRCGYRQDRGDMAGRAGAFCRRWIVSVWLSVWRGGCDVRPGRHAVLELEAGAFG